MLPPPSSLELPTPSPDEQAHSSRLLTLIRQRLADTGGTLDFEHFMDLALYAPGLGYYAAGRQKFGYQGDFVTAPEISPLFSQCLARQCAEILPQLHEGNILEFGAGTGRMAADVLATLATLNALPTHYYILELSPDLQQRQYQTLRAAVPELLSRVIWLNALPTTFSGVILANEVLDAMPVQRWRCIDDEIRLLEVIWEHDKLNYVPGRVLPPALHQRLTHLLPLPPGYESEFNMRAEAWIHTLAAILDAGVMVLIDYGYPRAEYYHAQRQHGTLRCYYRHRAHDDPFRLIGLQDITAHVEFTAMAEAGLAGGLDLLGFTHQAGFLIGAGLEECASPLLHEGSTRQLEIVQQIRKLTLPGEMGEAFKVLALGRGVAGPLRGFEFNDQRWRLGLVT